MPLKTMIEADKSGKPVRVYHKTDVLSWTHPYADKKGCKVCVEGATHRRPVSTRKALERRAEKKRQVAELGDMIRDHRNSKKVSDPLTAKLVETLADRTKEDGLPRDRDYSNPAVKTSPKRVKGFSLRKLTAAQRLYVMSCGHKQYGPTLIKRHEMGLENTSTPCITCGKTGTSEVEFKSGDDRKEMR